MCVCVHIHPESSFDTTASGRKPLFMQQWSLWLQKGLKVSEEVERTGCSEAVRGRRRRGGGRCLETHFCLLFILENGFRCVLWTPCLLSLTLSNRPSVLLSLSSGGGAVDIYVTVGSETFSSSFTRPMFSDAHAQRSHCWDWEYFWQTHHCLAVSRVTMETQHQVRDSCS